MRSVLTLAVLGLTTHIASAAPKPEELYREGQAAYDKANYRDAIAKWQAAYDLSGASALLFNLAQAYRLIGDCVHALSTYRKYVALDPTSEQRSHAEGFIADLEPTCGRPSVLRVEPVPDRVEARSAHMKLAGLATGGAAVVVLATGLVFGRRAVSLGDEVTKDCSTACDWSLEKTKASDGQRDATVGKVLDVVGAAALAAGIGLYIYGAREGGSLVRIQPTSAGATMSWSGQW